MQNDFRRWLNAVLTLTEADAVANDKAAAIVLAWVNGDAAHDTATWTRLFASVQSSLDQSKPTTPVRLWRNERRDNDAQYDHFTSWTLDQEIAADYPAGGGRHRQIVSATIDPRDIVCFVPAFGPKVDWLRQQEMIVRPGHYHRQLKEAMGDRICEAKALSPGLWTRVSSHDLQRLAATKHLRGYAAHDEVFVWDAYDDTHYGMTGIIGIEEREGIPFFVRGKKLRIVGSHHGDDAEGDWAGGHAFPVGDVIVIVSGENVAEVQTNRGFCRMVGLPVPKMPQRRRARFEPEITAWMATNGWDDALVDAYQQWSGGYWPWDGPDTANDGSFPYARWGGAVER